MLKNKVRLILKYMPVIEVMQTYSYTNNKDIKLSFDVPGIQMRTATPTDISFIISNTDRNIKQRVIDNQVCYVAVEDDQVCSYLWISQGGFYPRHSEYLVPVPPDTMYIYDVFTFYEHRGRGIYKHLLSYILHLYRKSALCIINKRNVPSIKQFKRNGFVLSDSHIYLKFYKKIVRLG